MPFSVDTGGTLDTNLVSYWKLNETSGTRVDSHSTNDLALGTEPGSTTGILGNAADFTGASSEYLSAGDPASLDMNGDFSMSFWIKSASTADTYILDKGNLTGAGYGIRFNAVSGKLHLILQSDAGVNYVQRGTTTSVNSGSWVHCIVTRTGNTVNWYINNGTAESSTLGDNGTVGDMTNSSNFIVGANSTPASYGTFAFDEFGFWTKVLNSTEIGDLYNSGSGNTYGGSSVSPSASPSVSPSNSPSVSPSSSISPSASPSVSPSISPSASPSQSPSASPSVSPSPSPPTLSMDSRGSADTLTQDSKGSNSLSQDSRGSADSFTQDNKTYR